MFIIEYVWTYFYYWRDHTEIECIFCNIVLHFIFTTGKINIKFNNKKVKFGFNIIDQKHYDLVSSIFVFNTFNFLGQIIIIKIGEELLNV